MENNLGVILNESKSLLKKIAGSAGCDYWADTDPHVARRGKIYAAISNDDATTITSITESINGVDTAVTVRSYLGATTLAQNALIIFDAPVSSITLGAGSIWVYYMDV